MLQSTCMGYQNYVSCFPITRNLYFLVPFLFKKTIIYDLKKISICCEELYKVWKNHMF
jgi:hypothetical protein